MRYVPVLAMFLLAALPGCGAGAVGPLLGAEAASVMVFGKGIVDMGVSAVSGRDCSLVRLDRGLTYCAARHVVAAEAYCTRSLGSVDCWADPSLMPGSRAGVADSPTATEAQARFRAARWPATVMEQP